MSGAVARLGKVFLARAKFSRSRASASTGPLRVSWDHRGLTKDTEIHSFGHVSCSELSWYSSVLESRLNRRRHNSGFTLVELAVVLSLICVLAAIGYGAVGDLIPRFKLVRAARQLEGDISTLRNLAIARSTETRLLLVAADGDSQDPDAPAVGQWTLQVGNRPIGSTRWDTLPADAELDGTDDDRSEGQVNIDQLGTSGVSLAPWPAIAGPGGANADAIVFSGRGWVANPPSDFGTEGVISLTLVNKRALYDNVDDSISLRIARSGRVDVVSSLGEGQ